MGHFNEQKLQKATKVGTLSRAQSRVNRPTRITKEASAQTAPSEARCIRHVGMPPQRCYWCFLRQEAARRRSAS
jgi:hypothetical protein